MSMKQWSSDTVEEGSRHCIRKQAAALSELVIGRLNDMIVWHRTAENILEELGSIEVFGTTQKNILCFSWVGDETAGLEKGLRNNWKMGELSSTACCVIQSKTVPYRCLCFIMAGASPKIRVAESL